MPREVESRLLQQRVVSPGRACLHLCGSLLVNATAAAGSPWGHELVAFDDPALAELERDRRLTRLLRTGYHVLTSQRFTVPVTVAMSAYTRPDAFDGPFSQAWAGTWAPKLAELATIAAREAGQVDRVVLLPNFERHARDNPWGPALIDALAGCPQASHRDSGLLMVGVSDRLREWLQTHYMPVLEKTPVDLPGDPGDTSLMYSFALGLWQPKIDGPLKHLQAALTTARDMGAAGVPLDTP